MIELRALALAVSISAATLLSAAAASADPGFDPSFGAGGVVEVSPAIPPPAEGASVYELRASPDGGAYATFVLRGCEPAPCPEAEKLFRYGPDGTPDHVFNGPNGGVAVRSDALLVDPENRPLVAFISGTKIRLVRFGQDGRPDPSFGAGGRVTLDCRCQRGVPRYLLRLRLRAGGGGKIVLTGFTKEQWKRPSRLWIARLLSDGTVDRGFGHRGATTMVVHKRELVSLEVSPRGAIYLASADCCLGVVRLQKVSAGGVVDAGFDARAARVLATIRPTPSAATLLPRDDGPLDVFLRGEAGLIARLRPNGEAATGFGRRGLLRGTYVESVARAGGGRTFAVVWRGGRRLIRLLANGRVDRSFGGSHGFPIPDSQGHSPVYVEPVGGGGAMVVDTGRERCRSGCSGDPPRFLRYRGR